MTGFLTDFGMIGKSDKSLSSRAAVDAAVDNVEALVDAAVVKC